MAEPTGPRPTKCVFRKEGEYWAVGLGDNILRLKDSRGLAYIAFLLQHPATEFHALDLAGGIAATAFTAEHDQSQHLTPRDDELTVGGLEDAGQVLDDRARRAYRQRLSELRDELEEAKSLAIVERAEQLEEEIESLTAELSRAVGVGGRGRRIASASERARQAVTKAIGAVIKRIERDDAALSDVLSRHIKTGAFCRYQPRSDQPIRWEFSTGTESAGRSMPGAKTDGPDTATTSAEPAGFVEFAIPRRTGFVNRENEIAAIQAAIARAKAGSGSLIMLGGGPGVGKTRLATEMAAAAARDGFACFLGRCYERDEPVPYLPFVQILETMQAQAPSLDEFRRQIGDNAPELAQLLPGLRRIFPDIPEPIALPDPQKRRYIFQSVTEALGRAAQTRPHLLIVDDVQWADESSLAFLTHLMHHTFELPLLIIATYRDEYSAGDPLLAQTLEELIREGVRPLKLTGLSEGSVSKMLDQLSQRQVPEMLVNAIFAESNGNPFFVEEVYRHLMEEGRILDNAGQFRTDLAINEIDVPESVRLIIARRLRHFAPGEMRSLSAAAVIGRSFSFQLLAAVAQSDIDELFTVVEKAQRMGIIIPSSEGPEQPFAFAHELVRQTLLASILSARRQQLHARVAGAIEQLNLASIDDYAGEIADHLCMAGAFADRKTQVHWLKKAGNAALAAAAFDAARVNFTSALPRVAQNDLLQRAELLYSIGLANRGLGRWPEAHAQWEEALEIFAALADQEYIAKTCVQLAEGAAYSGKRREAVARAEGLLAKLSSLHGAANGRWCWPFLVSVNWMKMNQK